MASSPSAASPTTSMVGGLTGAGQLAYWLRPPCHPMHWWFEHMGSMLGACIAATTAFLVTAGPRLGLVDGSSLLVWLAPTLVGAPAIALWIGYYAVKFRLPNAVRASGTETIDVVIVDHVQALEPN